MTDPVAQPAGPTGAGAELIPVPSGQPVVLQDVIWNAPGPEGLAVRFRFVAPQIARDSGSVAYEVAAGDIVHLCQAYALPRLADFGPQPTQIIISLSNMALPFGESAPEATQFFESFSHQDGHCIWEMF
ncbi:acetolactate synthase [Tabrizicola sp. WMC-M-20]|nr:acetolactate synthase [Tabrizicola sp. WMC-M-20]